MLLTSFTGPLIKLAKVSINVFVSTLGFLQTTVIYAILLKQSFLNFGGKAHKMTTEFPSTLAGFGYTFNEEGKLRKIDPETGKPTDEGFDFNISNDHVKNQRHYEALGEVLTERVYELLEENGMHRIYVPDNIPKEEATFIFTSNPKLEKSKKLLILIHGSGVVRAGQWTRSLIINHSLDHGTQIPYIKKGRELGYDILITNTNDNYRLKAGVESAIPGHNSPTMHALNVWEKFVMGSDPESVSIVAHSYGGVVAVDLAKKYLKFFKEKVFAVGFTDSVHSLMGCNDEVRNFLKSIGRNWVTSAKPLDEEVSIGSDIPRYSAGHTKHEWTSYSCMSALFDFFDKKYQEFQQQNRSKKAKLDL